MTKPIIVTDVDGVLVKWQSGLPYFAQKYGINSPGIQLLQCTENFIPYNKIFGDSFSEKEAKELFKLYNSSEYIKYLSAYRDAAEVVNELKERFDFISVSALSSDMDTILKRRFNLNAHFPGAFIDFFQCDADTPKTEVFQRIFHKYRDREIVTYIDDLPHNIEDFKKIFINDDIVPLFMVRGDRSGCKVNSQEVHDWVEAKSYLEKVCK